VGVTASASLVVFSDFDAERDLRARLGFGLDAVGVGAETAAVVDLRPSPSCFAMLDRCSE
jgi:hypothetical protein